ncbi:MAG: cytochrome ubiquinol oxidase subunit I [Deltaproteobacteria bacterium]
MAISLGFHIIFAVAGIAMPLMMVIAEWKWLRTKKEVYLSLTKHWAKGTAILFAVGAVSGTVLSFELGLLWPNFMEWAGSIIGMPFSLEGFAFFTEAIFLGIYLYGWNKVNPTVHLISGALVAVSGAASGIFVTIANAWMNTPAGFDLIDGKPVNIDPISAMLNPAAFSQSLHMIIAAYAATGFAVAGIHAFLLLKNPRNQFHQKALYIALAIGGVAAVIQPVSGDILAKTVAQNQPLKLAAFEGQFKTEKGAPLKIGGIPDVDEMRTKYALEIPYGLSLLAYNNPKAEVKGLQSFPRDLWPPVAIVHVAFQIMVAAGLIMIAISIYCFILMIRRKKIYNSRRLLRILMLCSPLGFIAIEAGWTVTEVGRQPWIIYEVMKTADALTPMPGLVVTFSSFTLIYIFLSAIVVLLLLRQFRASPEYVDKGNSEP